MAGYGDSYAGAGRMGFGPLDGGTLRVEPAASAV
ncbi:hypothetical protein BH24ACT26_BH24ACT26_10620 [soil metagenome]